MAPYYFYYDVVHGICLLTDLIIVLSYSDVQSRNLQLHDEQITNQKSVEGNLKVKTPRAKNRKSPYQLQAAVQQHPQSTHNLHPLQSSPTRAEISPSWQAPGAHKWYPQTKSPLVHTPTQQPANLWNSFITSRSSAQSMHEQSLGGSNSSCQGDNSTGQHTPHDSSPVGSREDTYWKPRSHCLFGTFDTAAAAQQSPEDWYKAAAYGSYYQQLAASAAAARSYSHIPAPAAKLSDFYYSNPYRGFTTPYASQIPYS